MTSKEDFIKRELAKTGFDLQDEVTGQLKELGISDVQPSYRFVDWETGAPMEIDLRATYAVTKSPILIEYVLLMECKRSPGNAWAFIKSDGDKVITKNALSMWDNVDAAGRQEELVEILKPMTKVNVLSADSHANRFKEVIIDAEHSDKKEDNILECTNKLVKAIYFEERMHEKKNLYLTTQIEATDHVRIFYPLIVFEGDMYEGTTHPDLTVRPISSVHLDKFSIENKQEIGMTIDVISLGVLKQFLKKGLFVEAKEIASKEKKNRQAYVKRIRWLKERKRLRKTWEQLSGAVNKVPKVPKIIP